VAEIVWSEPALSDLDAIADYIALENPVAASALVKRIFGHVEQLVDHPQSGSWPQELGRSRYRQIVEPPCRVFYRYDGNKVFVLHVMGSERLLRKGRLVPSAERSDKSSKWTRKEPRAA
jgi:plasmid stabilization system protein ParE